VNQLKNQHFLIKKFIKMDPNHARSGADEIIFYYFFEKNYRIY